MNKLKNKVSLIGRIGMQPEVKAFDSGKTLIRFSLATNESYKDKNGEWNELTQWHTINAWGKTAEIMSQKINKGQEVLVEGRLVNQSYETKEGEKRYATHIEVNEFLIIKDLQKSLV